MKKYLIYIRKYSIITRKYEFYIYECKTNDIFHTMGEIWYRTFERIKYMNFAEDNQETRNFWEKDGKKIYTWKDKYR